MTTLPVHSPYSFIEIIPRADTGVCLWNVFPGFREMSYYFATKEPMLMDANDLSHFAQTLKNQIESKPAEEIELPLRFFSNKPDLKIFFKIMREGEPYYNASLRGKVRIGVALNSAFSRTEDVVNKYQLSAQGELEYSIPLKINGAFFFCAREYFDPDELLDFASSIEKEARLSFQSN